jgi:hypothetical protein
MAEIYSISELKSVRISIISGYWASGYRILTVLNMLAHYLEEASDCTSSASSPIDDSISDDNIDDVSVAVMVPPPTKLVRLKF